MLRQILDLFDSRSRGDRRSRGGGGLLGRVLGGRYGRGRYYDERRRSSYDDDDDDAGEWRGRRRRRHDDDDDD